MNKYQLDRAILDAKQGELTNAKWSPLQRLGHFLNDNLYGNTREGQDRADNIVSVIGGTKLPDIAETAYQGGKAVAKIAKNPKETPDALKQLAMLILPGHLGNKLRKEGKNLEFKELEERVLNAQDMFKQGANPSEMRELTGLFNAPYSNKLLMDYDSSQANFNDYLTERGHEALDVPIRDIIEDDDLFELIPSLKDTTVDIWPGDPNSWGVYTPSKDNIKVNSTPSTMGADTKNTFMHELQHAVDFKSMKGVGNKFTGPERESTRVWDTWAELNNAYADGKELSPIAESFVKKMHGLSMQEKLQLIPDMGYESYRGSPSELSANYAGDHHKRSPENRSKFTLDSLFDNYLPIGKSYSETGLHKPLHMRRLLDKVLDKRKKPAIIPWPE